MATRDSWDAIIVGGGIAGLSAAIYLGRAQRKTLLIDSGKSMAKWEPQVQNYLGFPKGISGKDLLSRGRQQAKKYGVQFISDEVLKASRRGKFFKVKLQKKFYSSSFLLIATGIFHVPPDVNGVRACLGHSMFFCKDCDGVRVKGKRLAIYGANEEAVEYALAMLVYSSHVDIVTDGRAPQWGKKYARWIREYQIPVHRQSIVRALCATCHIQSLEFADGTALPVEAMFTTRGDVYYNELAKMLGAKIHHGEVVVDQCQRTTVPGLYAAGCVTPANCQMIIAAGQGAAAAQAINRELHKTSLVTHSLRSYGSHL